MPCESSAGRSKSPKTGNEPLRGTTHNPSQEWPPPFCVTSLDHSLIAQHPHRSDAMKTRLIVIVMTALAISSWSCFLLRSASRPGEGTGKRVRVPNHCSMTSIYENQIMSCCQRDDGFVRIDFRLQREKPMIALGLAFLLFWSVQAGHGQSAGAPTKSAPQARRNERDALANR